MAKASHSGAPQVTEGKADLEKRKLERVEQEDWAGGMYITARRVESHHAPVLRPMQQEPAQVAAHLQLDGEVPAAEGPAVQEPVADLEDPGDDEHRRAPRTYVSVHAGDELVAPRALRAVLGTGLNIAARFDPIAGMYSAHVEDDTVAILRSGDTIAVALTGAHDDDLRENIEVWLELFHEQTDAEVSLTLGVSPVGMRQQFNFQREVGRTLEEFLGDQDPGVGAAVAEMDEAATDDERWEHAISHSIENLVQRTHTVAAAFAELHAQVQTLPHAAVLVPVVGDGLVLFEGVPTEQAL